MGVAELMSKDPAPADGDRPRLERTTITPAPGSEEVPSKSRRSRRERMVRVGPAELESARTPYPGAQIMRLGLAGLLFALSLLTLAGAMLMLLLWQQDRDAGVLTTQVNRAWELFGYLQDIERFAAFALVPVATAWVVMATINVRRATGQRRNPIVAGLALLVGVAGVWAIGAELIAPADDWVGRATGYVLQAVFVAIPLLALERVAEPSEARRRPMHVTALLTVAFLVHLQEKGGLSTIEPTRDPEEWSMLGVYLVIAALVLALGALAANESARAIEDATEHRYELRSRFGESVLSQAGLI